MVLAWWISLITARKRSLGQGNIFSSMCQEFCPRGGGSASVHAGIPYPPEQTPQDQAPSWDQALPTPRADFSGTRHPPLCSAYSQRYGQQVDGIMGMHPTGMQSCYIFRVCSNYVAFTSIWLDKKILLNCLHNIFTYFLSGELWGFTRVCHSVHSGVWCHFLSGSMVLQRGYGPRGGYGIPYPDPSGTNI